MAKGAKNPEPPQEQPNVPPTELDGTNATTRHVMQTVGGFEKQIEALSKTIEKLEGTIEKRFDKLDDQVDKLRIKAARVEGFVGLAVIVIPLAIGALNFFFGQDIKAAVKELAAPSSAAGGNAPSPPPAASSP